MKKFTLSFIVTAGLFFNGQSQVWTNGQNANYVMGAQNLTSNGIIATTDSTFTSPVAQTCFALDPKHKCMYVADFFGHRVLRFAYPVTKNIPSANLVFGQTNFTNNSSGTTINTFGYTQGLAVDSISGTLWVLDMGNHRVLRFDSAHKITTNGPNANGVLGQSNFTSGGTALTASGMNSNSGPQVGNLLHYDHVTGALWVSDNGNIRVLRFDNAKTKANGAAADAVLGQSLFTTNNTGLTQSSFMRSDGITMIGSSLFVSDPPNNRVLRFDNVYSKANGGLADAVIGQPNFTSNGSGISASNLSNPMGLTADASKLYVSEVGNSRVLIYNSAATNTVANNVLLATNLTSGGSAALTASTGGANSAVCIEPVYKHLFVQDRTHNRNMIFKACVNPAINGGVMYCSGAAPLVLTASGATSYTWNTGATTNTLAVTPTTTTTYSIAATSTLGCLATNSAAITVSVSASPTVSAVSSSSLICSGQNATLTANGASTYTWNTSATTTVIVVSPTITTSYTVTGTNGAGCTNAVTITQSVSTCAGISQLALNAGEFVIYPNPGNGLFNIAQGNSSDNLSVEILNSIGQLIIKQDLSKLNGVIDLENMANGLFVVKIMDGTKTVHVSKLIKQ